MSTLTPVVPAPADRRLGGLLAGLQLADSAFPSGFYTLSHGLEGFAQARAAGPDDLPALLADLLRHSVGPADARAVVLAHRATTRGDLAALARIDERLAASKLSKELRVASLRTGRQLLQVAGQVVGGEVLADYARWVADGLAPGTQPAVAGCAYACAGAAVEQAAACELFAFASSFAAAALRLRLADHVSAQVLLRRTAPVIEECVATALSGSETDISGFVPRADVMSARHERAEARLFMS
jgi:urease accessory protein